MNQHPAPGNMNEDELRRTAIDTLEDIAADADRNTLDPGVPFRDQFELDSVDYLNFVLSLERQLGLRIPEMDYPRMASLDGCVSYLLESLKHR